MTLESFAADIGRLTAGIKGNTVFLLKLVALFWVIHAVNFMAKYNLNEYGIRTRTLKGLLGIPISPFLHADFNHLFFNTIPFFILSGLIMLQGAATFYAVSIAITALSGLLIWLIGQKGVHIGASSVIMGYMGFLLTKAYLNITTTTIVVAAVALYYFGGILLSIFPSAKKNVSWDGHLFGLASGAFVAYYLPIILRVYRLF